MKERNTCKRDIGGTKSVSAMKTTTKSSFENFHWQLPFRETYVKYFEKKGIYLWLHYIAFSSTNLL